MIGTLAESPAAHAVGSRKDDPPPHLRWCPCSPVLLFDDQGVARKSKDMKRSLEQPAHLPNKQEALLKEISCRTSPSLQICSVQPGGG